MNRNFLSYIFKKRPFALYKYYNEVSDIFEEPVLKCRFSRLSRATHSYRNNNYIKLYKKSQVYTPNMCVRIKLYSKGDIKKDGEVCKYDTYKHSYHKIPGYINGTPVWNRNIRKKLKKLHLSWLPTRIKLPNWMKFGIDNFEMGWKTKFSEYRFEYPPVFSIIFFGLCLEFWLVNPADKNAYDDDYWEAILYYMQYKDLNKTDEELGEWILNYGTDKQTSVKRLRKEFLKKSI